MLIFALIGWYLVAGYVVDILLTFFALKKVPDKDRTKKEVALFRLLYMLLWPAFAITYVAIGVIGRKE